MLAGWPGVLPPLEPSPEQTPTHSLCQSLATTGTPPSWIVHAIKAHYRPPGFVWLMPSQSINPGVSKLALEGSEVPEEGSLE
jgi:hypothetical protein